MGEHQQLTLPDPLFVAPTLHRRDHPNTSRIAAVRSAPGAATQRGRLLTFMHDAGPDGLTAFEAEELMRIYFPRMRTVRPRLVELRDQGWILVDEGRTRPSDSGSPAQVNIFNPAAEGDYSSWFASRDPWWVR